MNMNAQKVVRRFLASTLLASNVEALIHEAKKDSQNAKKATREQQSVRSAFVSKYERELTAVVAKIRPLQTPAGAKELQTVLQLILKALRQVKEAPVGVVLTGRKHPFHALQMVNSDLMGFHNELWDPEMFADGQQKSDYGRKAEDDFFDVVAAMNRDRETISQKDAIKTLQDKWTKNLLPTLEAALGDEKAAEKTYFKFLGDLMGGTLDKALADLSISLKSLT